MRRGYNWLIVSNVGCLLVLIVVLVTVFVLPPAINDQVSKTIVLEKDSDAWKRWVDTPVPIYLKVYIFTVNNPDDVMNHGAKPNLTEKGPYVYRETRHKEVVSENDNGTITYYQNTIFNFDKKLSNGLSDDDTVTVLNPFLIGVPQLIDSMPLVVLLEGILDYGITDLMGTNQKPITNTTVRELLFDGYPLLCNSTNGATMMLCSAFKHLVPLKLIFPKDDGNFIFALIRYKNNTMDGPFLANSGKKDIKSLGLLTKYKGTETLTAWGGDPCNTVKGSDTTLLPPFLDVDSTVNIFSSDVCAALAMTYKGRSVYRGVNGMRYAPDGRFLGSVLDYKENYCYVPGSCKGLTKKNALLKKGTWDITGCLGMPAILSYPHLHEADDYSNLVDGLHYDPEKHSTFLDVEPTTGTPLRGYQRVQLNLMTINSPTIERFHNLPTTVFPIFWFEEGFELPENLLSIVKDQLIKVINIVNIIQWTLIAVGLLMAVVGEFMSLYHLLNDSNLPKELN